MECCKISLSGVPDERKKMEKVQGGVKVYKALELKFHFLKFLYSISTRRVPCQVKGEVERFGVPDPEAIHS